MGETFVARRRRSTVPVLVGSLLVLCACLPGALAAAASGRALAGWAATEAPLPDNANQAGDANLASLSAVSCPAAGWCAAAGYYDDTGPARQGLLEVLSGGVWQPTEAPLPAGGVKLQALESVSCPASGWCEAVGEYRDASNRMFGLIEKLGSGHWTATQAPLVGGAANPQAFLRSVSCPARGSCVAVGTYDKAAANDPYPALVETLASGVWTAAEAALPSSVGFTPTPALYSVSCAATGSCAAAGYYDDRNQQNTQVFYHGLLEELSGGSWQATEGVLTQPGNSDPTGASVSCPAAGACGALIRYGGQVSAHLGLLATLSSGTWSQTDAPAPADSASPSDVQLFSISCGAVGACVAVGEYADSHGGIPGLAVRLASGSWTPKRLPLPVGANPNADLFGVTCPSASHCVAGGDYTSGAAQLGLLERYDSGHWTAVSAPLPPSGGGSPVSLSWTSCRKASFCVAVGFSFDTAGQSEGLIELQQT